MPLLTTRPSPGRQHFRWLGWATVTALVAMALLAPASPALSNDTAGNNGTVKIHEGSTETEPIVHNEPHVCTFHLHFFFSDPEQSGTWEIQEWSPGDKGTVVLSGTYDTFGDGEDRQPEDGAYQLPDGHYKLFWDGDLDTQKHDKMKVFWVECASESSSISESSSSSETSSVTQTSSGSETSSSSETSSGSETSSVSETSSGSETSSVSETSSGSETSSVSETSSGSETSSSSTSFSQTVSGTTTSSSPTLPNTATVGNSGTKSGGSSAWLLLAVLGVVFGCALVWAPSRAKNRE